MRLGEVGEFALIERIERLSGAALGPGVRRGIGDDAALLRLRAGQDLVVSTDALVEGVHFRFGQETPRRIGRRAATAALSDLAAMGAGALGLTLALAAPPRLELRTALGLVRGLVEQGRRHGAPLVGGNVTRARETSLTLTALGAVERGRALRRDAARPGDRICVTGPLGGAALARVRAERDGSAYRHGVEPRLAAGRALGRLRGIGACIDLSDGLLADLAHLLEASGVGAELDAGRVPRARGLGAGRTRPGPDPLELVLTGGEDYELLFTLRRDGPDEAALQRRLGLPVREIGRVTRAGLRVRGAPPGLGRGPGWRHF